MHGLALLMPYCNTPCISDPEHWGIEGKDDRKKTYLDCPEDTFLNPSEGANMEHEKMYIAVDLGAESGRVMLGAVSDRLSLEEIHRFPNGPIDQGGSLHWDFDSLFAEIRTGIAKAISKADGAIVSIAVDSWGVDFGLLDAEGQLIENPYNYRDSRTDGVMDRAFELMGKREIYDNSGLQFMQLNTIYQLLSMRLADSPVLKKAKKLIFMADLVGYHLCGRQYAEYTLASTSQLMDMRTGKWSKEIFDKLQLPIDIMPDVVMPGTCVGSLMPGLCEEFGCEAIDIIAAGSHDTASAVAAVPASQGSWAYLSSGTWSLMGVETAEPIINDESFEKSFTNEGGADNTIRFLKNIMGLWLLQECRRQWQRDGVDLSYSELAKMADEAKPFAGQIDLDYGEFLSPGDMPAKINAYLAGSGQSEIEDKGQMARVILESLAIKYRGVMAAIEGMTGSTIEVLHVVGGGIKNELLCQFTANATGKRVVAGPVEATASGNILIQAIAAGQVGSIQDAREVVARSFELREYLPADGQQWHSRT